MTKEKDPVVGEPKKEVSPIIEKPKEINTIAVPVGLINEFINYLQSKPEGRLMGALLEVIKMNGLSVTNK